MSNFECHLFTVPSKIDPEVRERQDQSCPCHPDPHTPRWFIVSLDELNTFLRNLGSERGKYTGWKVLLTSMDTIQSPIEAASVTVASVARSFTTPTIPTLTTTTTTTTKRSKKVTQPKHVTPTDTEVEEDSEVEEQQTPPDLHPSTKRIPGKKDKVRKTSYPHIVKKKKVEFDDTTESIFSVE